MDMLSHCCGSVIWDIDNVWQGWPTPRTTTEPPTSHASLSGVTLGVQWFVRLMFQTKLVSTCIMVQGKWHLHGYTTSQTLESYMRYGLYVRGVDNPIVNINTINYTCFTPYWYTDSRHIELDLCPSKRVQWFKENDTCTDMLLHRHWSVIRGMDNM